MVYQTDTHRKIKKLREIKEMTQQQVAEQMFISTNAYGRLERGETSMTEQKLKQIAEIFGIDDFTKIISTDEDKIIFLLNNVTDVLESDFFQIGNYIGENHLLLENEKLKLVLENKNRELSDKEKLLSSKDEQILILQELVKSLKQQIEVNKE